MDHIFSCKLQDDPMMGSGYGHRGCKCWCHDKMLEELDQPGTNVIFEIEDSDISNPPEDATWYPINHPNASWNNPK